MLRTLVFAILGLISLGQVEGEVTKYQRLGPTLTVERVSKQLEFKVGEQQVVEFKATVAAADDQPIAIRAWTRFFAEYDVLPDAHGPLDKTTLSDVLSTGGQLWRDGVPVVLWNAPEPEIFRKAAVTKLSAGSNVQHKFRHNFGGALKAGTFHKKLWFAVVVEPTPGRFMLLFSREPIDVEFKVGGDEIDLASYLERTNEWLRLNGSTLHDRRSIQGEVEGADE